METNEMVLYFQAIRNRDGNIGEMLDTLANSMNFCRMALFVPAEWERLYRVLEARKDDDRVSKKNWPDLAMPAIFLSVCEMSNKRWNAALRADLENEPENRWDSLLYTYIRNRTRDEIQRDLFDGSTFFEFVTHEEEWPADPDEPEDPWEDAFYYDGPDVEEVALDTIVLDQVRDMVSDMEWEIIMAEHGDGPMLAEKYKTSESNIRNIRQRTLEKLHATFCDE